MIRLIRIANEISALERHVVGADKVDSTIQEWKGSQQSDDVSKGWDNLAKALKGWDGKKPSHRTGGDKKLVMAAYGDLKKSLKKKVKDQREGIKSTRSQVRRLKLPKQEAQHMIDVVESPLVSLLKELEAVKGLESQLKARLQ